MPTLACHHTLLLLTGNCYLLTLLVIVLSLLTDGLRVANIQFAVQLISVLQCQHAVCLVKQSAVGGNAVLSKQPDMGLNTSAPSEPVAKGDELLKEQDVELEAGQQQHLEAQEIQPEASEQDGVENEMAYWSNKITQLEAAATPQTGAGEDSNALEAPEERNALKAAKNAVKVKKAKKAKKKVQMKGGVEVNGERVKLEEDKLKVVAQLPDTSLPDSDGRYVCKCFSQATNLLPL